MELVRSMMVNNKDIEIQKLNYTADGIEGLIKDTYDEQLYEFTMKPKR